MAGHKNHWLNILTVSFCNLLYHSIIQILEGPWNHNNIVVQVQHPDSERGSALRANPGFLETNLGIISGQIRIFVEVDAWIAAPLNVSTQKLLMYPNMVFMTFYDIRIQLKLFHKCSNPATPALLDIENGVQKMRRIL